MGLFRGHKCTIKVECGTQGTPREADNWLPPDSCRSCTYSPLSWAWGTHCSVIARRPGPAEMGAGGHALAGRRLRPRECRQKARKAASLPPTGTSAAALLPPSSLGGGLERGKARAGNGHVPRCQITRVMGSKHVHPKASPSGGVLVALAPLCAFVALLQHPDWAWRLRQPKWIQASRAARRCIPRSWHQTSDSEIGTCDGCNWDGLAT